MTIIDLFIAMRNRDSHFSRAKCAPEPPIESAKALHSAELGGSAHTSPSATCRAAIDHAAAAHEFGLAMPASVVVIFGNPQPAPQTF